MKKKTKIAMIVLPLILILLTACVIFFRPLHYSGSYTACTLEGDTVLVEFDVTLQRRLWNGDKMTGRILVDGREFMSIWDLIRGSRASVDGYESNTRFVFYLPALNLWESFSGDEVILDLNERGRFETFSIVTINKMKETSSDPLAENESIQNETHLYFGPAASRAEAEKIANEW